MVALIIGAAMPSFQRLYHDVHILSESNRKGIFNV